MWNKQGIGHMCSSLKYTEINILKSLMYENVNAVANRRMCHSMNITLILKYKKEEIKTGGVMLRMWKI